ncbi:MAG: hypothetical protein VYA34_05490 [Myxococcota bacterium]|nr:hypothetical protein [Myxococcota bacterium]
MKQERTIQKNNHVFLLSIALSINSCLLPPPFEAEDNYLNLPPRIEANSLDPHPAEGAVRIYTVCGTMRFSARLVDPNLGDTLYWRVFLNYDLEPTPLESQLLEFDTVASTESGLTIEFEIDPQDFRFTLRNEENNQHYVELLLSDRPFSDNTFPKNRFVADQLGYQDLFAWPVFLDESTESCPGGNQ